MCNQISTSIQQAENTDDLKPEIFEGVLAVDDDDEKSSGGVTKEGKALLQLASPLLLINIIVYSRTFVSTHSLGRLGQAELAGGTLAMTFASIFGTSVLTGLALGMEPICSQAFGAEQRNKLLSITLHRAILFHLALSIPIAISFLFLLTPILLLLKQEADVISISKTYILFTLPDLATNSLFFPIRTYLRAQKITVPITCASIVGTVIHVPANVILVLVLDLGVAGVAIAAAFSNLCSLVFLIGFVWIGGLHRPTWTAPTRDCLRGWGPLVKLSSSSCLSVCLEWWVYEIMTLLGGKFVAHTATVGAMGLLIQATGFIYNFPSALGFAVSTGVGNALGANRPVRARRVAAVGICMAGFIGVVAAGLAVGVKDYWGGLFSEDETVLGLAAAAMPILAVCELGNCPQTVACGVVRGTARPHTAAKVNFVAFYGVGIPIAVGLGLKGGFGLRGLWVGLLMAQICCAGMMLYVVWRTDWAQQAQMAHKLTCTAAGGGGLEADVAEVEGGDLREPLLQVVVPPPPI